MSNVCKLIKDKYKSINLVENKTYYVVIIY